MGKRAAITAPRVERGAVVRMSDMDRRRQDMQVQWLKEAIKAQQREPEDCMDRASLRVRVVA
jgi:hypothetical protein